MAKKIYYKHVFRQKGRRINVFNLNGLFVGDTSFWYKVLGYEEGHYIVRLTFWSWVKRGFMIIRNKGW